MCLPLCLAFAVLAWPLQEPAATPEIVAEVRIHGNHTTPDAEILKLAGIVIGQPLEVGALEAIAERLERSGRFEGVEVRKRYRSLTDTSSVVLVLIIDERPNPAELPAPPVLRPIEALLDRLMFLPILSYADGYGFTYGGRASFANVLGGRSRVSVPLTWGAHRRAAVEGERLFKSGPISRAEGGLSFGQRENPYYDVDDRRGEVWLRAERRVPGNLRVGGRVGWTDVEFGEMPPPDVLALSFDPRDRFTSYGVDVTFDTRTDPTFPRNAVFARAAWEALRFDKAGDVERYTFEGRGHVGLIKSVVLSVRALHGGATGPLPVYEQWLLGGASTLRGFRTGSFAGDRLFATSAEIRVPLTSPMNVGKIGFTLFADAGKVWQYGGRFDDAPYYRGYGAGLFFNATLLQLNVDVARGSGGDTRVHVGAGFSF
jgi:outer membrane protein assembly factor BamA